MKKNYDFKFSREKLFGNYELFEFKRESKHLEEIINKYAPYSSHFLEVYKNSNEKGFYFEINSSIKRLNFLEMDENLWEECYKIQLSFNFLKNEETKVNLIYNSIQKKCIHFKGYKLNFKLYDVLMKSFYREDINHKLI